MSTVLLLGATGLTGREVLHQMIASDYYDRVVTLGRRPMSSEGPKHVHHVVDFDNLEEQPELFAVDHVFCCLGTTIRKAGSQDAFRRVDLEYPVTAARLAFEAGASQFLLISSMGANPQSRTFYSRIKGETEDAIAEIGFKGFHVFRPSLLVGDREESRVGEKVGEVALKIMQPLLVGKLRGLRPTPVKQLASVMVDTATQERSGHHVYENREILERG